MFIRKYVKKYESTVAEIMLRNKFSNLGQSMLNRQYSCPSHFEIPKKGN
jgi:hypothetical protein